MKLKHGYWAFYLGSLLTLTAMLEPYFQTELAYDISATALLSTGLILLFYAGVTIEPRKNRIK